MGSFKSCAGRRHDLPRQPHVPCGDRFLQSTVKWKLEKSHSDWWPSVYGVFLSHGDHLLLPTREGVFAFDRHSGKQLWRTNGQHGRQNKGGSRGNIVCATTASLAALRCTDGKVLWNSRERVGDTASVPAIAADRVVLGTSDGRICAFSLKDGSLLWKFRTGKSISDLIALRAWRQRCAASAVICKNTVYVGASDGVFYATFRRHGKETVES